MTSEGFTALMNAVSRDHITVVTALIDAKAEVLWGYTCMHFLWWHTCI